VSPHLLVFALAHQSDEGIQRLLYIRSQVSSASETTNDIIEHSWKRVLGA